jgi:hypothetical protein
VARTVAVAWLMLVVGAVGLGCGSTSQGDDDALARAAVFRLADLPAGSRIPPRPLLPGTCNPARYFRSYATGVAITDGFRLPHVDLLQSVGIFASTGDAQRAITAFDSAESRRCVVREMHRRAREADDDGPGRVRVRSFVRATHGAALRITVFELTLSDGRAVYVERAAIAAGRGVNFVGLMSRNRPVPRASWDTVVREARRSIARDAAS